MIDLDVYDPSDPVILDCARFCFMGILRKELLTVANDWNQHLISKSKNDGPSGRPDTIFFLPHLFETQNYLQNVDSSEVNEFQPIISELPPDFSKEFQDFLEIIMSSNNLEMPTNPSEALNLYFFLVQKIDEYS